MRLDFRLLWQFPKQGARQDSVLELYSCAKQTIFQCCQDTYREPRQRL